MGGNHWHFVKSEVKKDQVIVILRVYGQNMRIVYQHNSKEGIILRRFGRELVGQKLGILRTDIPAKPIVVRIIPKKKSTDLQRNSSVPLEK